jgi:RNA polymerase sigma-70 factor, ECF subfamily
MTASPLPPDLVEGLFRHRYGQLVAQLCRALGPDRLDLCEDVVQEAVLRALRTWPASGVPDDPAAWLFRVAKNAAFDALRRRRIGDRVLERFAATQPDAAAAPAEAPTIADDTLRLLFVCAHPDVPADARVPLLLKTVCGLGTGAIARGLLLGEAAVAQRLSRAKARLQQGARFALPEAHELPARLDLVQQALYLLFNEGYRAHGGATLQRCDLVDEAIRLQALLLERDDLTSPAGHALLALMLLQGARTKARCDEHGDLVPLAQQDRSRWDRRWIAAGFSHFRRSIGGATRTAFHVEAAIASVHAVAPSYADTDWAQILAHYDELVALAPSPVVQLNRAVAVGKVHGAAAGLQALAGLADDRAFADYALLWAVTAQLHWERGAHAAAATALRTALGQPMSDPERRLLERRLAACERADPVGPW